MDDNFKVKEFSMKNKRMILVKVLVALFTFSLVSCSGGGGGKSLNSAEALKEYLDSQPANSPDKPIKVSMAINDKMLEKVDGVIKDADKYVSLNITGNVLTTIDRFGNDNLVGITLSNSVTKIESITLGKPNSITIPAGVTEIGSISGVSAINVNAANANFSSQDGILFNKDKTTLLRYPDGKTGTYTIPSNVTTIGTYAFSHCSLTSVTLPDSVKNIEGYAFAFNRSLTSVNIPNSVIEIGSNVFNNSHGLTSITIPASVTSIGEDAFSYCDSLTSITIPASVTSIGRYAFAYCENLTSITFEGKIPPSNKFMNPNSKGLEPHAFGGRVTYWSDGSVDVGESDYSDSYIGDLYEKYIKGGPGTYTRAANGSTWRKQ